MATITERRDKTGRNAAWLTHGIALGALLIGSLYVYRTLPDLNFGASHENIAPFVRLAVLKISLSGPEPTWRWQQELAHGAGEPMLNFYAPGFTFLSVGMHALGFSMADSILAALAVAALAGLLGWYALGSTLGGRLLFGGRGRGGSSAPLSGFATSAFVMWAPYTLANAFIRTAFAEYLALAVLPWLLLCLFLMADGRPRRSSIGAVVGGGFALAGIIVSHNITALLTGYVLLLWWVVLALGAFAAVLTVDAEKARQFGAALLLTTSCVVLGLGLSAAFWFPAVSLRDMVYLSLIRTIEFFSVDSNFLHLWQALLPGEEWRQIGLIPLGTLSFVILAGFVRILLRSERAPMPICLSVRAFLSFVIVLWVAATIGVTEFSRPAYHFLPMLSYVQFPFRLFGWITWTSGLVGALALSSVLALALPAVPRPWHIPGFVTLLLVALAVVLSTTQATFARELLTNDFHPDLHDTTIEEIRIRLSNDYLTAAGVDEYRPKVAPEPVIRGDFILQRPDYGQLAGGAYLLGDDGEIERGIPVLRANHVWTWTLPPADRLRHALVGAYAMPGWEVLRNGSPLPGESVEPGPFGYLQIRVPPEGGEFYMHRTLLPAQKWGNRISLLAAGVSLALLICLITSCRREPALEKNVNA